jgi:hypothetical protein
MKTSNDYSKNRTVRGKGNTESSLKYRLTMNDNTDTGSIMDTERPMSKASPYMDISANWDSVKKQGSMSGKA